MSSSIAQPAGAGEMTDTVRTSLAWVLQALMEAEVTAVIGAEPHERTETGRLSATAPTKVGGHGGGRH